MESHYITSKLKSDMKVKIVKVRIRRTFMGESLPSFTDEIKYLFKYKFHWCQRYKTFKDRFGKPILFANQVEIEDKLKQIGFEKS